MPIRALLESLPQRAYSATQVLENEASIAKSQNIVMYDLMESAGSAVFSLIQTQYFELKNLLVVCGKGNNGGDGFVIARLAAEHEINVTVYLCCEHSELKGDAKFAFEKLAKTNVTVIYQSELSINKQFWLEKNYEFIVDAMFGIGFRGELSQEVALLVEQLNQSALPIISVDVPSGLNATTGYAGNNAIVAQHTVTFIVVKQGLLTGKASNHIGDLYLADLELGEPFQTQVNSSHIVQGETEANDTLPDKPNRAASSHKGNIGLLLSIGGNQGFPGAIRLASEAALRAGAALVSVHCHQNNQAMIINGRPELMLSQATTSSLSNSAQFKKAKVLLCGPGLGKDDWAKQLFQQVVQSTKPCVLDADALQLLAINPEKRQNWVLTPHPGEAAKLLNCTVAEVEKDRFEAVSKIVHRYGGICVLKGAGTLIYDGSDTWINTSGNSGMASGGMGDVLSGIIAALLMQVDEPISAARLGVFLHGQAADVVANSYGKIGMLASDLFPHIQMLVNRESSKVL